MRDGEIVFDNGSGPRRAVLSRYLDPSAEQAAQDESYRWIKGLRHALVDGQPLRRRFTFRGDSLWWFAELYLHKRQVVLSLFRTISAAERLIEIERPLELSIERAGRLVRGVLPQIAAARRVRLAGRTGFGAPLLLRVALLEARAAWLHRSARASRLRPRTVSTKGSTAVAAFVHRAFSRSGEEAYIGPVLDAIKGCVPADDVRCVSVGPSANFRARRWWHSLRPEDPEATATPVERYAPLHCLAASRQVWRQRHALRRALWRSEDLRRAAVIRGVDCWPIIREELAGIALLQWPWSARAMDEAAAALEALQPRVAITYAEAGGWGRALVLECRRRNMPSVGVQHGFIYRHWLNYRHEPDEMEVDRRQPADGGFPRPTLTLLFDEYAAQQLTAFGHFPRETLAVIGSPRLDDLVRTAGMVSSADQERTRVAVGAGVAQAVVLVATKYSEAKHSLPALVDAAAAMPEVRLAIKPHPAETPEVYKPLASGRAHVTVLPVTTPLAPLLCSSRLVATVNSTVALDAAVLGIPALVLGLPNNLAPFVEAGIMAGGSDEDLPQLLRRILYDEPFRQQLARHRGEFLSRFNIRSDGRAAQRAAEAIARLGQMHVRS
jgi:hypothetical protein